MTHVTRGAPAVTANVHTTTGATANGTSPALTAAQYADQHARLALLDLLEQSWPQPLTTAQIADRLRLTPYAAATWLVPILRTRTELGVVQRLAPLDATGPADLWRLDKTADGSYGNASNLSPDARPRQREPRCPHRLALPGGHVVRCVRTGEHRSPRLHRVGFVWWATAAETVCGIPDGPGDVREIADLDAVRGELWDVREEAAAA